MLSYLTTLHTNIFFTLYEISQRGSFIQDLIIFFAETIDIYIIALAILIIFAIVYRSLRQRKAMDIFLVIEELLRIGVSVGLAYAVSFILKHSLALSRPFLKFPEIVHPLFYHGGFNSFPSGHATFLMALAVVIFLYHKRFGFVCIVFVILLSLLRVIAGIHFPIDILAGWIIGGGISYLVYRSIK